MRGLLGGEVGVEKTDEPIENKYKKLQELNRRKSDRIIYSGPETAAPTRSPAQTESVSFKKGPGYLDRVRMNFAAARQEHGIMTISSALASVFSFLLHTDEYVNPKFLLQGDEIFFNHVEKLVLAVRGLLALNQRHPLNRLRNPLFVRILSVLKNWDIESLHSELTHLQIAPRHVTFKHCKNLTKKLYLPIVQLLDLAQGTSIVKALKHLYDLDILSLPVRHPDIQRIKDNYHTAATEYEYLFNVISRRCYPLLMKLACSVYQPPHSFFMACRAEILSFLDLSEEEVLQLPASHANDNEPEEPEVVQTPSETRLYERPELRKGFEILERLFPQAGLSSLEEFPDLYPYFQPLIGFPRGFELVPPENPLHQTVVLASIIQELLRGFRNIEFGTYTKGGQTIQVGPYVDSMSESWKRFLDELIATQYLPTLYEYCRDIERHPGFGGSAYGSKQRDYLDWLGKAYIFPHLVMGKPRPPETTYSVPKLYELTSDLKDVLASIASEIGGPEKRVTTTVKRPSAHITFDIEDDISRRFVQVLRLYGEDVSNANLILYSYSILLVLDTLLNNPESHFYPYPAERMYRNESEDSPVPQYSVPLINPAHFFEEADRRVEPYQSPPARKKPDTRDELTDLLNAEGLRQHLDAQVDAFRNKRIPFVVLAVLIRNFKAYCESAGENAAVGKLKSAAQIISGTIREFKDIPARAEDSLFMVLLPETVREEAVHLAIRLFIAFKELEESELPVSIGIVQFERTWGAQKCVKTAKQAAQTASALPPPSLCLYDGRKNKFQSLSEVYDNE